MKKILIVARYTFNEAVKSKILLNIIFLGLTFLLSSYIASELTYGTPEKSSLDIGMGLTSLAVKIIAIFYGVNILQNEIENRSIYLVLSRPISKVQYFLGRTIGMSGILFLNVLLLGSLSMTLYFILGGELDVLMVWSLIFTFIESLLLLLIVLICSLFSSKVLSILLGISSYVCGYTSVALLESNHFAAKGLISNLLSLMQYLLPNFTRLNLKDYLIYKQSVSLEDLFATLSHSFIFILIYLAIGSFLMNKKSLD